MSYNTIATADTYISGQINASDWLALTDSDKTKYLTTAYRAITSSRLYTIPSAGSTPITQAEAELANHLVRNGTNGRADLQSQGVKSFSVDGFSESYGDTKPNPFPSIVQDLLYDYRRTPSFHTMIKREPL